TIMREIANLTQPSAPKEPLDPAKLDFGRMFTPNFFVSDYRNGEWTAPRIQPLAPFSLHPASNVFHYAQTVFEGLKAYRHDDGEITLFRPDRNAARFRQSAKRLGIPEIDESFFLQAVRALVENERNWVPAAPGCVYVRPTVMGVEPSLGVKASSEYIFFVLTLPSGSYFKGATSASTIDVLVSTSVNRAGHGGMGSVKAGANYAGTLEITEKAKKLGCAQVLFMNEGQIDEMGGMNILFVQNGRLRTPPLTDTILNGVTRDSLLTIARDLGIETSEAPIPIDEIVAGLKDGSITDMMACGTAAVVIAIRALLFEDGTRLETRGQTPGRITQTLYEALVDIQYGRAADRHGWVNRVCRVAQPAAAR
ncbi:MAG TPA: branched-chain amino acid aminotransferase, partial [Vicinamibacterales bacterium]|nr:branched-chain amino acid aminotransferase [Vicinamibacterales bacterium]